MWIWGRIAGDHRLRNTGSCKLRSRVFLGSWGKESNMGASDRSLEIETLGCPTTTKR